ncbi:MAG TPA: hypothetical protein VL490_11410 [Mucilaginibacter sp.]|jgi:hypothetical protein|nr:hypothetical protein [Mucilaginibacter sp.]
MEAHRKINLEWIPNAYAEDKESVPKETIVSKPVAPIVKSTGLYPVKKKLKIK